jgi:hypothetical protein
MARILSKYAALYIWEPVINKSLIDENLYLTKVICIKRIKGYEFVAYFEVEPLSGISKKRFGQFYVSFNKRGNLISNSLNIWNNSSRCIITNLKKECLIFDQRSEFDWIQSSDTSSESE